MEQAILDQEEYFQMIKHYLIQGDWSQAYHTTKDALNFYDHGELYYLYGSICAHEKKFDEAVKWLEKSLENNSQLISRHPAIFQLGLIHITSGQVQLAKDVWQGLDDLETGHYFRSFSDGMICLVENDFNNAQVLLENGIDANHDFPSINSDMQFALAQINNILGSGRSPYAQDNS